MAIIRNQDDSLPVDGDLYPSPEGWEFLPPGLEGLDGVEVYGSEKWASGEAWFVVRGSPAWVIYVAGLAPKRQGMGSPRGKDVSISIRPGEVDAFPVSSAVSGQGNIQAPTGEGDPMPEFTNDPSLGVVPVGQATDQSTAARFFRWPSRLFSKALPVGPVASWQAVLLAVLPFGVWGLLGWWLYRRFKR
jgi:hypothetical protein